ncbi:MAG: iron dependent repressor, metal binding and dimerization domain protein [Bacilli bacterium]|nr:iron dependent repressor, metal binding and dimerization domain protein [Bacilli bacterium]MDD4282183.1 iron dependent repressor, metal binding and dimerization domain protein [Bacilli bacterium]MDD4718538.1 iron dependent repressor, metal binding and dimerization domain protein [Bacilli bacterium]
MSEKFHTVRGYELQNSQKKITPAMEDYLEMIYRHNLDIDYIRTNELAKLLNVRNSSVTKMIQKLEQLELLNHPKYGVIKLTKKGQKMGDFLLKRHITIEKFLTLLGIKENILIETELIEHVLSSNTINMINDLNCFLEKDDILNKYNDFKNKD